MSRRIIAAGPVKAPRVDLEREAERLRQLTDDELLAELRTALRVREEAGPIARLGREAWQQQGEGL